MLFTKLAEKFADIGPPYLRHGQSCVVTTVRIFGPAYDVIPVFPILADGNVTILKDSDSRRHAGICLRCPGTWVVSILLGSRENVMLNPSTSLRINSAKDLYEGP